MLLEVSRTVLLLRFARQDEHGRKPLWDWCETDFYGKLFKFLRAMLVVVLHGHQVKILLFPDVEHQSTINIDQQSS